MNFLSSSRAICFGTAFFLILLFQAVSLTVAQNPIVTENNLPGTSSWRMTNAAIMGEIEGYASATSAQAGETINFYISTSASSYTYAVYRLGYYQGLGARQVLLGGTLAGQRQSRPVYYASSRMYECQWTISFSMTVQSSWTSGYFVVLLTNSQGKQTYIPFVVKEPNRQATYFMMASSSTWLAYNNYGGKSSYDFNSDGDRSYKVSLDRPYAGTGGIIPYANITSQDLGVGASFLLGPRSSWEYSFVRFIEKEGYDVVYFCNLDLHNGYEISPPKFKVALIIGHDEYWSVEMRMALEAARDRGLNLAFFGANICFWRVRFEPSPSSNAADRVMVIYKDAFADPFSSDGNEENDLYVSTRWRWEPRIYNENLLLGVMYRYDPVVDDDLIVSDASNWIFAGTGLTNGARIRGLLGYEVDETFGVVLPNLRVVFNSPYTVLENNQKRFSQAVIWRMANGAFTFATGTIQWAWGLDDFTVTPGERNPYKNADIITITRNILQVFANPPPIGVEPVPSPSNVEPVRTPPSADSPGQRVSPSCTFSSISHQIIIQGLNLGIGCVVRTDTNEERIPGMIGDAVFHNVFSNIPLDLYQMHSDSRDCIRYVGTIECIPQD